jgi:hypothetical protein
VIVTFGTREKRPSSALLGTFSHANWHGRRR